MKKQILITAFTFCGLAFCIAQKTSDFFIGMGGGTSSYQDQKYSNVRHGGFGGTLQLGLEKASEKNNVGHWPLFDGRRRIGSDQ